MTTKDNILETLRNASPSSHSVGTLIEATGKSETTVRKSLKELVAEGVAAQDEHGAYVAVFTEDEPRKRANHGYARNTKTDPRADKRDGELLDFLQGAGEAQTLKDIAEGLGVTVRTARHAVWRNMNRGAVEKVERKFYQLVEEDAA